MTSRDTCWDLCPGTAVSTLWALAAVSPTPTIVTPAHSLSDSVPGETQWAPGKRPAALGKQDVHLWFSLTPCDEVGPEQP